MFQEALKEKAKKLPEAPGVYFFKKGETWLYVGKAVSLRRRVLSYFQKEMDFKTAKMLEQADVLDFLQTPDEASALLLESNLIKEHHPRYNILFRDDKQYPYLKLTVQEPFPRVLAVRRRLPDGARYFGPYPQMKLREIIKAIHRFFHIRDCDLDITGREPRACLSYEIGQCPAPCIGAVSSTAYRRWVKRVEWFLEGQQDLLIRRLRREMLEASRKQAYEEAARRRDLIATVERMRETYPPVASEESDFDVLGLSQGLFQWHGVVLQIRAGRLISKFQKSFEIPWSAEIPEVFRAFWDAYASPGYVHARRLLVPDALFERWVGHKRLFQTKWEGVLFARSRKVEEKSLLEMAEENARQIARAEQCRKEALEDLQRVLELSRLPRRMVGLDISTLQGKQTVGSAVVFSDGLPEKQAYRKFKIRSVIGPDDFAAHREMIERYLRLLQREGTPAPDVFVVDGGKGQLAAVARVVHARLGEKAAVCALAKREEEVFLPGRSKPLDFNGAKAGWNLLRRLRDESHRFAVTYHRKLRDKSLFRSFLENCPGIGPARRRKLLESFESLKALRTAPEEHIRKVLPELSDKTMEQLLEKLKEEKRVL